MRLFVLFTLFFPSVVFAQHSIEGAWSRSPGGIEGGGFAERNLSWGKRMHPRATHIIVDLHADRPSIEISEFAVEEIISLNEEGDRTELMFHFTRGGFDVTAIFHFRDDGTMWIEEVPLNAHSVLLSNLGLTGSDRVFHKIDGPEFDEIFDFIRRARSSLVVHTTVEDLPLHEESKVNSPVITILPAGSLVQFRWWEPEMEVGSAWVRVTAVHSAGLPKVVEVVVAGIVRSVIASGWIFTDMFVGMTDRFLRENLSE